MYYSHVRASPWTGLTRPALHMARQQGRLNAIASGISDRLTKQALNFYVHKTVSEWSRFTEPPYAKRRQFDTIRVPVTTCGEPITTPNPNPDPDPTPTPNPNPDTAPNPDPDPNPNPDPSPNPNPNQVS